MLSKLGFLGLSPQVLKLFYLKGYVGDLVLPETSDTFPIISGVNRDFIISPFLFSLSYAAML